MIQSKLEDYVIHTSIDDTELQTFTTWWKSVAKTEQVEVKFPYHRHGLSGRMSNHAKLNVMANFLELWMPTHNQMDDVQIATVPSFF